MATLRQLKKEAAKHGAELEIDKDFGCAEAWLPDGMQWGSSQAQCVVVSYGYTGKGVMADIYDDLIEHMQDGAS